MVIMTYVIKIQKGELWNPERTHLETLRVLEGKAWVTLKNSPHDYVVGAGELLPVPRPGVLIESLTAELVLEGNFRSR
jgi:quercetin dioxygenase-like cupin family protein